ncbi:MAG: GDSL-type esterase/lipase family protein [Mucilaginibacter sp.]|uniref:SGNH/GDSL hydrolase family protein n=1 Tax=Mucilaginibacter sp. TaxID=1882438 RepID=UPI0031AE727D
MKTILLIICIIAIGMLGCKKEKKITKPDQPQIINTNAIPPGQMDSTIHNGTLTDTHIKYFGRWVFTDPKQYQNNWGGSYLKVNFTGTTVKLKVGYSTNYYTKIDDGSWISHINKTGVINLSPTPLSNKIHTLTVAQGKDNNYVFDFQGLILDTLAVTSTPVVQKYLIEYIGDSITAGYTDTQANVSDYAWIVSDSLHTEHTQIAYPGICLVDGYPGSGMSSQYFKTQSLYASAQESSDWLFQTYSSKLVVINLGTNDFLKKVPDTTFKSVYIKFCKAIRAKLPGADIFLMRPFNGAKATAIQAVVSARHNGGDPKVHYIDTTGWLSGLIDYTDGTHPNDQGQIKIAAKLKPVLAAYLDVY